MASREPPKDVSGHVQLTLFAKRPEPKPAAATAPASAEAAAPAAAAAGAVAKKIPSPSKQRPGWLPSLAMQS